MTGGGGFLTPLGGAAQPPRQKPARTTSKSPAYTSLLSSARTASEAHEIRTLVSQASGRASRTLRDWNKKGVPLSSLGSVQRAAAVWRLGGVKQAADAFGLSLRRTMSWLSGKGRRSEAEKERIQRVIDTAYVDVRMLVRLGFEVHTGGLRSDEAREIELIITISERDVETINSLVRAGDTFGACEILKDFFFMQYWFEDPTQKNEGTPDLDVRINEILDPRTNLRSQAQYVLTPTGVIGPGYES